MGQGFTYEMNIIELWKMGCGHLHKSFTFVNKIKLTFRIDNRGEKNSVLDSSNWTIKYQLELCKIHFPFENNLHIKAVYCHYWLLEDKNLSPH